MRSRLLIVFLSAFVLLTGCGNTEDEQTSPEEGQGQGKGKSITVGLDPYNYATIPAYLSKVILDKNGYEVKIREAQVGMLFSALADGDIDAFIDIWAPNLHKSYLEKLEGQFEIAGTLYSDTPIGIAVPTYLEDVNSITDLKEHREKFDNNIYAIEKGSGMALTTREMLKTYNMKDYSIVNSSTAAMVAQAKKATNDKKAIAFNAWRPHIMFREMDLKFLKDPKKVWKKDDVQVGVVPDLEEKAPLAYTLFSNMKLEISMIEEWLVAIDQQNKEPQELAEEWVKQHPDKVKKWLGQ